MVTLLRGHRTLGLVLSSVMGRNVEVKESANITACSFCSCFESDGSFPPPPPPPLGMVLVWLGVQSSASE